MKIPREPTSSTISALLRQHAEGQPDAVAILAPGRPPLTYIDLWRQVQRIADTLQARCVTPSVRVAVVLPNGPEMASTFLGVAACAACAPLNPAYRLEEFRFLLEDTRAQFVVVAQGEQGPVRIAARELSLTVLEIESYAALEVGQFSIGTPSPDRSSERPRSAPQDTALILHTSGTTARPKLVPLSQANLVTSARNIARWLALQPSDRCLNVMPLFHIHGLVGALLASLAAGSSIICTSGFDDHAFFDWVAQFEPSWYTAVPTIHQSVVTHGARYRQVAPRHHFRFVRSSSAALPPKTFEALRKLTGAPVIEAYGMTEASHQMASSPLAGPHKPGSVGMPAGVEMALMEASGQLSPPGASGEVVIRGPSVSAGYENNPEANATAFTGGWFRTGDLGRFDEEGCLYISGRLKEIINRGGEKISPREIDEALIEHPGVAEAAAFAAPHSTLGEDVVAAVVRRQGADIDELALRAFLINRLAGFKVPSRIVFVDALPQGATGKVRRASLHDDLAPLLVKTFEPPRNEFERSLEKIFREVLGCGPVGVQDNFFALGGDSLKGAQVMARIRAQHGLEIAVPKLFAYPTIATLAVEVEAAKVAADGLTSALASEIDQMSDEEVARLLSQEEGTG